MGILLAVVSLTGCTTYHGLKPITPTINEKTTNTRPTFQWHASEKSNVNYDFIVYDLVFKRTGGLNYVPIAGETVYYRENLEKPEHILDTDLKPGKTYLWSVRVREGEDVGPWSLYDFSAYYVLGYVIQKNHLYPLSILDPTAERSVSPVARGR
jgi:hypothetical protein